MKRKIKLINPDGKVEIKEITIRDEEHLRAQIKFPARIQRNKKTYTRKYKHKNRTDHNGQF